MTDKIVEQKNEPHVKKLLRKINRKKGMINKQEQGNKQRKKENQEIANFLNKEQQIKKVKYCRSEFMTHHS